MRNWATTLGASLCAAMIVAVAFIIGIDRYHGVVDVAERDTRNVARLVAAHASQAFFNVLSSLRGVEEIRSDYLAGRIQDRATVGKLLNSVRGNLDVIHSLGWTDENGDQIGRSADRAAPNRPANMSRREHFVYHRDTAHEPGASNLHIARPVQTRKTREWILIASIRLENAGGEFAGVAGAAVDPGYFAGVYRDIELGPSRTVTLYRSDGVVLSRSPDMDAWIGRDEAGGEDLFRHHLPTAAAATYRDGASHRIVSYEAVAGLPLVVAVSLSMDDAVRPFYVALEIMVPLVFLVVLILVIGGTILDLRARDRRRAQAVLAESEARYRALTELAPVGVFRTDADGNCTYVNATWCEIAGMDAEQALGRGWSAALHPEDRDRVLSAWHRAVRRREVFSDEFRMLAPDGRLSWLFGQAAAVADGRVVGYVGAITDTTKYRQAEEALARAGKMEAIGQLTGGLAHDLNNVLGIIGANVEMLRMRLPDHPDVVTHTDSAMKGVSRASELTRKLLDFSRTEAGETQRVSINEFIQGMESLIAKSLTPATRVDVDLDPDLWPVDINPGDLEDSILNLALNARDAIQGGGVLTIETRNKVIDDFYVDRNRGSAAGDFVMISVSDTGSGMTRETVEKAIEPFFTTKDVGKGTGLGLSMVYGFVRRSGGHMKIYSEVGEGTAVHLYLPRAARSAEAGPPPPEPVPGELPRGEERILVVDDEAGLRASAAQILESLGYRTVAAANGSEALEVLRDDDAVDLLFSDVIMPGGMDGYRLAVKALALRTGLKVLLTSGFTGDRGLIEEGDSTVVADLARRLLRKPYNVAELAVAVRAALDGPD